MRVKKALGNGNQMIAVKYIAYGKVFHNRMKGRDESLYAIYDSLAQTLLEYITIPNTITGTHIAEGGKNKYAA